MSCKDKDGHPHPMEKLGFDLDDGSSPADAKQTNPQVISSTSLFYKYVTICNNKYDNIHIFSLFHNSGSPETVDTEVHSIIGARLPVQRCQLPSAELL